MDSGPESISFQIVLIVILTLVNAYFAASEMAIVSVNKTKIKNLSEAGNKKAKLVEKLLEELASHSASKVHDRHYDYVKCKELGLKVVALEKNQDLQDAVLSLYHAYICSIYKLPNTIKFIENHEGQAFIINGQR